jgi:hypothetical protein
MTIITTTRPTFRAAGDIRGYSPRRTTLAAAQRDCDRDHAACASLGGGAYSDQVVVVEIGGRELIVTEDERSGLSPATILELVGDQIAKGLGHVRRPRLACDDWAGWIVGGGSLYRVSVRWPDAAEQHEVHPEILRICNLAR